MIKIIKELAVDSFYLYCIQGLNYLFPLLVLPYLITILGPESFGIFAYSQSFVSFLILIVDFGFNVSVTKRLTLLPVDSPKVIEIYWITTILKLILFSICFIIVFAWLGLTHSFDIYRPAILWSMLSLLGSVLFPVWWFQGLNRIKLVSLINAISKVLTFPLIFVFVVHHNDYLMAVILQSSSILVAGIISLVIILKDAPYRKIPFKRINRIKITKTFKDSWPIFLSNSSTSLYTSSLTIILGFFATTAQVGLFGAIERVVRVVCFGIYVPINQASFPKIARLKIVDFKSAIKLFKFIFYCVLAIMITICIIFMFTENFFIERFFKDYINVRIILRVSIFTIIPIALGAVCGQLGLLAIGGKVQKKAFSKVYIIIGVSSLVISLASIKYFNVNGAVFSMMITEIIIFIAMLSLVKKYKYL